MKTKIPELRKAYKISQEELARSVGVTRQTITSIEVIFDFEEELNNG